MATKWAIQPAGHHNYLKKAKEEQKRYFDKRASHEMDELQPGTKVKMQLWENKLEWQPATVIQHHTAPRSYVVQTERGRKLCCNRRHLRVCPAAGRGTVNVGIPNGESTDATVQTQALPAQEPTTDSLPAAADKSATTPSPTSAIAERRTQRRTHTQESVEASTITRSGRWMVKPQRLDL